MSPKLPSLTLGDFALVVESITGHGAEAATLSVQRQAVAGKPGRRVVVAPGVTRDALIAFAIELLALSEQMVDGTAYATTDSLPRIGTAHVGRRHDDALKRFSRLRDRLPILQLAQKVLERADDGVANTLLALLASVEATGSLPIRVEVDFKAASKSGPAIGHTPDDKSAQSKH